MSTMRTVTVETDKPEFGEEKLYKGIPGSTFFGKDGSQVSFDAKGELRTKVVAIQEELDKVVNKAGSPLYTGDSDGPVVTAQDKAPNTDIKQRAQDVLDEINRTRKI